MDEALKKALVELRNRSGGVSIARCLEALDTSSGDVDAALLYLRNKYVHIYIAQPKEFWDQFKSPRPDDPM